MPFDLRWEDFRWLNVAFVIVTLLLAVVFALSSTADALYLTSHAALAVALGSATVFLAKRWPNLFFIVPLLVVFLAAGHYFIQFKLDTSLPLTDWTPIPMLIFLGAVITTLVYQPLARIGPSRSYYRGVLATYRGDYREAVSSLSRFINDHAGDPDGHYLRAGALSALGRNEDALKDIEMAVARGGTRLWQYLAVRAWIISEIGDPQGGLHDAEAAYRLGVNPVTRIAMAQTRFLLGRFDEAVALLDTWSTRRQPFGRLVGAEAFRRLGEPADAAKEFAHAERLAVRFTRCRLPFEGLHAYAKAMLMAPDEALASARVALARNGCDSLALKAVAICHLRDDDVDGVLESLRLLADTRPYLAAQAMDDPLFATLIADPRFQALLETCHQQTAMAVRRVHERHSQPPHTNGT
jgi:tetratricopeptide (TPR) repeat protein